MKKSNSEPDSRGAMKGLQNILRRGISSILRLSSSSDNTMALVKPAQSLFTMPTAESSLVVGLPEQGGPPIQATDPKVLGEYYLREIAKNLNIDQTLRYSVIKYWREAWWRWNGRRHVPLPAGELRAHMTEVIRPLVVGLAAKLDCKSVPLITRATISNVFQAMSGAVLLPNESESPCWLGESNSSEVHLSMQNGLLNLDGLLDGRHAPLIPHTPEYFTQVAFPYPYEPGATCDDWLEFLNQVLEGDTDRIALLREWFGYCLIYDLTQHKFLVMEGEGANGKSVVCEIFTAMLGSENVSHVPLEMFGERFQLTPTLGKIANIVAEIGEVDRVAEGFLKQFTSGDRMYFDRKGIQGVDAYPTARLVFATNQRPRFRDRSRGLWRRMILMPFRVQIPDEQQDKKLPEKLKRELPGIFNWAVEGLRRLREKGYFTEPSICKEALGEYRLESNPARVFLLGHFVEDPAASVDVQFAYDAYRDWAETNGYRGLNASEFGKEVRRAFPKVQKKKRGARDARRFQYVALRGIPIGVELVDVNEEMRSDPAA